MPFKPILIIYALPLVAIWAVIHAYRSKHERRSKQKLKIAIETGMHEPASLHPIIDPAKCLGCAACVKACPEGEILGIINGKAQLIEPSHCIGHGACEKSCPTDAISLVFGTATRGVDIPFVSEDFQTNVNGIYIAGELGGMGLIRNAVEQGRQAMASIIKSRQPTADPSILDVIIIGAGPSGISASLGALEAKLNFKTLEQDSLGGTVAHFPRGKLVMTAPAQLPIYGKVHFKEVSKEALLAFWEKVVADTGLQINFQERVTSVENANGYFTVTTTRQTYASRRILLAIGRRGTPRTLEVPGEHLPKVVYRLVDPEQYRGRHVLVVGGGDSALEAAASIAEEPDTTVTLSYRGKEFSRAKKKNQEKLAGLTAAGRLTVLLESKIMKVENDTVHVKFSGQSVDLPNNDIIVCAGGLLPTAFLQSMGIEVETKYGSA
jgi:thioredoxin reductase (NADPH)